jgi:hypothetical protein
MLVTLRLTEATSGPYFAVGLVRPGLVAAVSSTAVSWFHAAGTKFRLLDRAELSVRDPIACYPLAGAGQLVVLGGDGTVALIPVRRS